MAMGKDSILRELSKIGLPGGGDLVSRDMIRALSIEGGAVRFVIEAPDPDTARALEPVRAMAERALREMAGVTSVSAILTAHDAGGPSGAGAPPSLKVGQHPQPGPAGPISGIDRILVVASGKGGVGKSTVSSNLAVALARQGRRVGLLDADIYGPSQPRMLGVTQRPSTPDGKRITPLVAHGVTMMSIGLMLDESKAVVWRGPMVTGALQQLLTQVDWGQLDVLIIDLPPGTGDVQLSLAQRTQLTGALVVSTPQDVALLDARRAIDMLGALKTPVLGLIENMSVFTCPHCGKDSHIFGHGGVRAEAEKLGLPLLAELPLSLDVRLGGDAGTPIAAGDGPEAEAYAKLAKRLIDGGMA